MTMTAQSKRVESNQVDIHSRLLSTLKKHVSSSFQRPRKERTKELVESLLSEIETGRYDGIVLDLGCGVGDSTYALAGAMPDNFVLGIDKSKARIDKGVEKFRNSQIGNARLAREDIEDFMIEAQAFNLSFRLISIFYPNPWPKKGHLNRRIYASPIFPLLLKMSERIELRTNWELFAREFALSSILLGRSVGVETIGLSNENDAVTLFEKKYFNSRHILTKVLIS